MVRPFPAMACLLGALVGAAALAWATPGATSGATSGGSAGGDARVVAKTLELPGPAPRPREHGFDPRAENAACEGCHDDIAKEWRGSLHRNAFDDDVFQEAYQIEPFAFCRGCHAPESDPDTAPTEGARAVGVGCTTCHSQGHDVVGSRAIGASAGSHAVVADTRMSTTDACAACHQFDFPAKKGAPMQNTLEEHAGSNAAGISCQSCHMREVDDGKGKKHLSHAFSVIGDPAMIRSAAKVSAGREGSRDVVLTLSPGAVGHAFPTGDMFRRLEVRAHAVDASGKVVLSATPVRLVRSFADRPSSGSEIDFARVQIGDTRLAPPGSGDGRKVTLHFDRSVSGLDVRYSVVYQRMATAMAASFGVDQPHDEIVVADGVLAHARGP